MPKFAFSAKDARGVLSTGVREASNAGELAKELAATGVIPLLIKPEAEAAKVLAPTTSKLNRKVKLDELIIFSHQKNQIFLKIFATTLLHPVTSEWLHHALYLLLGTLKIILKVI